MIGSALRLFDAPSFRRDFSPADRLVGLGTGRSGSPACASTVPLAHALAALAFLAGRPALVARRGRPLRGGRFALVGRHRCQKLSCQKLTMPNSINTMTKLNGTPISQRMMGMVNNPFFNFSQGINPRKVDKFLPRCL